MTFVAPPRPLIGDQIRRARHRKRWTQRQLADAVEVDRKTVDNWENDRSYPRNRIGALEDVLGVTLDEDGVPRDGTGHRVADRDQLLEAIRILEEDIRRRDERNGRAG